MRTCSALVLVLAVAGCTQPEGPYPTGLDDSLRPDTPPDPMRPPPPEDPPGIDTPPGAHASQIPATLAPVAATRIIVVGDTPSAGGGAPEERTYFHLLATNDDEAWPDHAEHDVETLMGQVPEVLRFAVYNANASSMELVQLPQLSTLLGDTVSGHSIVVMTIGIHDVLTEVLSDDTAIRPAALEHIRNVVSYFRDPHRFPDGTSIYLVNVVDPTNGTGLSRGCFLTDEISSLPRAIDAINAQYLALGAELGIGIVDAHGYFMGHGFAGAERTDGYASGGSSPATWFMSCVVPNERGHNELRKLLFEALDSSYLAH